MPNSSALRPGARSLAPHALPLLWIAVALSACRTPSDRSNPRGAESPFASKVQHENVVPPLEMNPVVVVRPAPGQPVSNFSYEFQGSSATLTFNGFNAHTQPKDWSIFVETGSAGGWTEVGVLPAVAGSFLRINFGAPNHSIYQNGNLLATVAHVPRLRLRPVRGASVEYEEQALADGILIRLWNVPNQVRLRLAER